ncbi:MAG: DDE-type integrase/transposase/recombinase [Candidatus Andersenbacteria bacterium]|nr:DDE-type integrase/transposase/recombinase [Candidatus Andersenbacteria bacterium]
MAQEQLHKRRTSEQVTDIISKYKHREIKAKEAAAYLGVGRTRFYQLVAAHEEQGSSFSIAYARKVPNNRISPAVEKQIRRELQAEKKLIENQDVPVWRYNYSYVRDQLLEKYQELVSVNTIISRAKEWGFYQGKPPKQKHEREVVTNYTGELIQHDSSHHLFAPLMGEKLYLATSLDDFSRALLYAELWEHETAWRHITAAKQVILEYGVPLKYYTDQHSIFRYVKNRDSHRYTYQKFTDDVDPQWRQVLKELTIEPIPALSPQAKGKIERPYGWIQDRMVRTCMNEKVTSLPGAQEVLRSLVYQYNWKWRHSTTGEIPMERYQDAIREKKSLWRPFKIQAPYRDINDIFCLRTKRMVDAYRKVSIHNTQLKVPAVPPRQEVELRLSLDEKKQLVEVRFWFKGYCVGKQTVKMQELPGVHF